MEAGSIVGRFYTEDLNEDDLHVYSLEDGDGSADNNKFKIYSNQLKTK